MRRMGFKLKKKNKEKSSYTTGRDKFDRRNRKIKIKFDKFMLEMFVGYLTMDSKYITRANYINMKKLFEIIDDKMYETDEEQYDLIQFIRALLEARVDNTMTNINVIMSYCLRINNANFKKFASKLEYYGRIKESEIRWINRAVVDRLKYAYIVFYKDIIYHDFERLDNGEYESYEEASKVIREDMTQLLAEMRQSDTLNNIDTFSLDDNVFDTIVTDIVNKLKDKSRRFTTGIRALNNILSPGFLSGRLYMFLARTANFKSGILLSIARWFKTYNFDVKPKRNPNAIPTVLLITTENSVAETVARLFAMVVPGEDIEELSPAEVIQKLKQNGRMTISSENSFDIVIKYYNDREIDTNDIYGIIEDIENDNREVMGLIVDYIKRIRASESGHGDERIELKNASNELKSLAQNLDIPVITAMQINRAGNAIVENAMSQSKEDLAKFVGSTNIANCWDLVENSDWVCIINIEKHKMSGQYYLTFKRTKIRYADKSGGMTYFNHPFADGDKIRLLEDVCLPESLSINTLATNIGEGKKKAAKRGTQTIGMQDEMEALTAKELDAFVTGKDIYAKRD